MVRPSRQTTLFRKGGATNRDLSIREELEKLRRCETQNLFGGEYRIRTDDPLTASQVL